MPSCPKCHQSVDSQAVECPYCRTALKAYGHPGMNLYQATGDQPLCLTCTYHEDDSCNYPKRPFARDCTMYRDRNQSLAAETPVYSTRLRFKTWFSRNSAWLVLVGLILISLAIALLR